MVFDEAIMVGWLEDNRRLGFAVLGTIVQVRGARSDAALLKGID